MTGSSASSSSSDVSGGTGRLRRSATTQIHVPDTLLNYLARRCDAPDSVLAYFFRQDAPGRKHSLSSKGDVHLGVRPCSLSATTVITFSGPDVKASIVSKDWTITAGPDSTDLIQANTTFTVRAFLPERLLVEYFEPEFLPRTLKVKEVIDRGRGALIRCQALCTTIELALPDVEQCLDDVSARVSGSGRSS